METKKSVPHSGVDRPDLDWDANPEFVANAKNQFCEEMRERIMDVYMLCGLDKALDYLGMLNFVLAKETNWLIVSSKISLELEQRERQTKLDQIRQEQMKIEALRKNAPNESHISVKGDLVYNKNQHFNKEQHEQ